MMDKGGYDVWLETTEAYARQLERGEDYTGAATYYLACQKIHEAVAVLRDNKLFREAVALASVRFSPFDPAFTEVYKAWASHLEAEGSYGQAAKCYLKINQPADAVMLLARRSDIPSLSAALRVSCLTDQSNLTSGLMVRYLHECLMAGDWLEAQGLLANHRRVLSGSLVAAVHEVIVTTLTCQKLIPGDLFMEARANPWLHELLQDERHEMDDFSDWTAPISDQATLFVSAVQKWFLHCGLDQTDTDFVLCLYNEVRNVQQQNTQHLPTKQLLIEIAFELTLGQLSRIMTEVSDEAVPHWLLAVLMCHDVADMDIARGVLALVLPERIQSIRKLKQNPTIKSLHAHYLFTVLYQLLWKVGNYTSPAKNLGLLSKDNPPIDNQLGIDTNSDVTVLPGCKESLNSSPEDTGDTVSSSVEVAEGESGLAKNSGKSTADFTGVINETAVQTSSDQNGLCTEGSEHPKQRVNSCTAGDDGKTSSQILLPVCSQEGSKQRVSSLEDTLVSGLMLISQALLKERHAMLRSLRGRLGCIQQAVGKLVAQHARKAHEELPAADQEGLVLGDRDQVPCRSNSETVCFDTGAADENSSSHPVVGTGDAALLKEHSMSPCQPDSNKTVTEDTSNGRVEDGDLPSLKPKDADTIPRSDEAGETLEAKQPETNSKTLLETPSSMEDMCEVVLPSNWEELTADIKYSHPAVTYAVLLQEQQGLMQDLNQLGFEVEDRCPFPDTIESAMVILHICRAARHKINVNEADQIELQKLGKEAAMWGLKHSWLTDQRKLFNKQLADFDY